MRQPSDSATWKKKQCQQASTVYWQFEIDKALIKVSSRKWSIVARVTGNRDKPA